MSIKISNIRLELGEPEETLPGKIASRLAISTDSILGWRIIRKSLDARGHDDVHFAYSAAVELSDSDSKRVLEGSVPLAEAYDPERFWWPDPGSEPLNHRPVIVGAGTPLGPIKPRSPVEPAVALGISCTLASSKNCSNSSRSSSGGPSLPSDIKGVAR